MTDARKTKKELEAELEKLRQRVKKLETLERRGKQAEKMFHSAFENAPVAMCLLSPQGRFLNVNAAFCRMLGYSKDELLSMGFAEVMHPDDLPRARNGW